MDKPEKSQIHCNISHDERYHPSDFDNFVPWACIQMGMNTIPVITRTEQIDYSSSTISSRKAKSVKTPPAINKKARFSETATESSSTSRLQPSFICEETIKMNCVYSINGQLVQIKFSKAKRLNKCLFKVLALAIPFHKNLMAIHINGGLKHDLIYDLDYIVATANITEVVLDNMNLENANVHILLEENKALKHLSLARCTINDEIIEKFALKLNYPLPASKTLCAFNLSSNMITDIGAKYIGEALRTNRRLAYLNLSGNMITDTGADHILSSLKEFSITTEEIKGMKLRHLCYLKDQNELKSKFVEEIKIKSIAKKLSKVTPTPRKSKTPETLIDTTRTNDTTSTSINEGVWFDSGVVAVKNTLAPLEDPFISENVVTREGITYCLGNNTLCYLSLAYNSIGYFSLKQLLNVLKTQRNFNRQPKGLINICIEGNNLPNCTELKEINSMIEAKLGASKLSINLKKKMSNRTPR